MIPTKVHFVGSIALDTVEEVFTTLGASLGRRLHRVPDGEPGGRSLSISWQYPFLRAQYFLKADTAHHDPMTGFFPLGLAEHVAAADIRFGELGYAREARVSYLDFVTARNNGRLSAETRFQVSLPTPFGVIFPMCLPKDERVIETAYERAILNEVERICRAIPHRDLCIQWDVCLEMLLWDGRATLIKNPFANLHDSVVQRLQTLSRAVPKDVELGFHLCYGDFAANHFIEPEDAGRLVDLANALAKHVDRPITYFHMPVPPDRFDDSYYKPLPSLQIASKTELYLGLIHPDGIDNNKKRISAAAKYVRDFGIAAECGIARTRSREVVKRIIQIHAELSSEPALLAKTGT